MEKKQQIRSSEVQDILTRMPHWILIWSNSFILILLVFFFLATWFIKYPDVISGETKIISINPIYRANSNISGRLDSIMVKESNEVRQGQILAIVKNNASLKDVMLIKNILDTISLRADNFSFPLDSFQIMSLGELSASYALFENEFLNYRIKNSSKYYSNPNSNQLSIPSLKLRLKLLEEQKMLELQNASLGQKDHERIKKLYNDGVVSEQEYERNKMELKSTKRNLKNIDISIEQLHQSLNEANRASSESDILKELEKTRSFKSTIHALATLQEDIKSWEDKYLIRSEIDGLVSFMGVWNENQVIAQGDHFCSIIPSETRGYIARLLAPETNSGKIRQGQKVNIRLLNYAESEFGFISGHVSSISALPSPEGFYSVEVALPARLQTSYNIEIPFQLEMSGTADIITDDLRLFERFFYRLKGIIS